MLNRRRIRPKNKLLYQRHTPSLRDKTPSKFKKISRLIVILALAASFIYLIFFSGYLTIDNVTIKATEAENLNIEEQLKKTLTPTIGSNLFFLDLSSYEEKIKKNFSSIKEIKLEKNYPHSLKAAYLEYSLAANLVNESRELKKNYIINEIGYVIKEDYKSPTLPQITLNSAEPINIKKAVIPKEKLQYILETIKYFEDKFGMKVKEILYKPVAREIHLITEKDFSIWLDIQIPYEKQLKKLKKALVKLDIYTISLEYIDLRIAGTNGDKIIYKRK